jgi:hypothetical protein
MELLTDPETAQYLARAASSVICASETKKTRDDLLVYYSPAELVNESERLCPGFLHLWSLSAQNILLSAVVKWLLGQAGLTLADERPAPVSVTKNFVNELSGPARKDTEERSEEKNDISAPGAFESKIELVPEIIEEIAAVSKQPKEPTELLQFVPFCQNTNNTMSDTASSGTDALFGRMSTPSEVNRPQAETSRLNEQPAVVNPGWMYPLPQPGASGIPYFKGEDITEFLRQFEKLCKNYGIRDRKSILEELPDYCTRFIREEFEELPEWKTKDWDGFVKKAKELYRDSDVDQLMISRAYLHNFVQERRPWEESSLRRYIREFTAISNRLVEDKRLENFTRCVWFIRGLPKQLEEKLFARTNADIEKPETMKFSEIVATAEQLIERKKRITRGKATTEGPDELEPDEKEQLARLREDRTTLFAETSRQTTTTPNTAAQPTANQSQNREQGPSPMSKEIADLTESLRVMSLAMQAQVQAQSFHQQPNFVALGGQHQYGAPPPPRGPNRPPPQAFNAAMQNSGPQKCYYCGTPGCIQPRCPEYMKDREQGLAHWNVETRKIHIGPFGRGGPEADLRGPTLNKDLVAEQFRSWSTGKPSTNTQPNVAHASVNYAQAISGVVRDVGKSEEETEDAVVVAAFDVKGTAGQKRTAQGEYAKAKSHKLGRYDSVEVPSSVPVAQERASKQPTVETVGDIDMVDSLSLPTKKPTAPKLAALLKGATDETAILERIIKQRVENITIEELLGLAPGLHRAVFSVLPTLAKDPNPSPTAKVNLMDARVSEPVEDPISDEVYSLDVLSTRVWVNGNPVKSIIDSGSGVNVMNASLAIELGVDIKNRPAMTIVLSNKEKVRVIGCVRETPVQIGDVLVKTPIFVMENMQTDLLLGRPFARSSAMVTREMPDGSCECTIFSSDRTRKLTFVAYTPGDDVCRYHDIWPNEKAHF